MGKEVADILKEVLRFWREKKFHRLLFDIHTSKVDKKKCLYVSCPWDGSKVRFVLEDEK